MTSPPFIRHPADPNGEDFRLDCLAWWLITHKSGEELEEWLGRQEGLRSTAFRDRLERCLAWWWFITLNRAQIEAELLAMPRDREARMRAQLNAAREQEQALRRATHDHHNP